MYTLVSFAGAVLLDGLVLERTANRMRLVVSGMADALELQRAGEDWFTEKGESVEFQFLATASKPVRRPQPCAAGASGAGYSVI